ncbi:MAG: tRNA epoxyqueuosine(34) reductase QueG [Phycisphaerales bacterium JB041]
MSAAEATSRTRRVLALCEQEGFALSGAAMLEESRHGAALREWLDEGKHGEMSWLAETLDERLEPTRVLPGARSVVMVADFYGSRGDGREEPHPGHGRIARYARGRDYHAVLKRRLHRVCDRVRGAYPGASTRAFCDTAPVLEREMALRCGLGWIGKHTLLIHATHGSWMVLGGFLTTLELTPPPGQRPEPDHCGTCTRCIDACPTDAITPYSVDARRCISYLTIEHEAAIEPALAGTLGDWLVGCDVCQEVCPHNSARGGTAPTRGGSPVHPALAAARSGFDLLEVLGWDEESRRARFASSAMKRITLAQAKRNAILAGLGRVEGEGVSPGPRAAGWRSSFRSRLVDIAWDAGEAETVRETARAALTRLDAVDGA